MIIRYGTIQDVEWINQQDKHISLSEIHNAINVKRIYMIEFDGEIIGWLRYNLFWDNTPFMNMLYLLENYREKGYGKIMVNHWEQEMRSLGFETVLTSTASNEYAQHFYMKLGYQVIGGFLPEGDPYEVILRKEL